LDSPDAAARLAAAQFFYFYSALARPDGEIRQTGGPRPFWTETTRQYVPSIGSVFPEQYVAWWKGWWLENRGKLGFHQAQDVPEAWKAR
jgi:hypothetical protein